MSRHRLTVGVEGYHPLLQSVAHALHNDGARLTDPESADLLLASHGASPRKGKKTLLLSSGDIYHSTPLRKPVVEDQAIHIHIGHPHTSSILTSLRTEDMFRAESNTLIVRPFGVWGPLAPTTFIDKLFQVPKGAAPVKYRYADKQLSYLWQEDFIQHTTALAYRLLKGTSGTFNVGSSQAINLQELADYIHFLRNPGCTQAFVQEESTPAWRPRVFIPDMVKTAAMTGYRPRTSLKAQLLDYSTSCQSKI